MAAAIVIAFRLVIPLSILRWPLAGGIACLLIDAFDVVLVDALASALGQPLEFGPFYAQLDKWLDTYYLAFEAVVARRWPETALRRATLFLFVWRLIGVLLFEATAYRPLLLAFPNLFENVFLYTLIVRRVAPQLVPRNVRQTLLVLVVLLIPKLVQEWVLHWEEMHPWQWLRQTLFGQS
jgi:hypothetical protein